MPLTNDNWVAVDKDTGEVVAEFSNPRLKDKLNTDKYVAVDLLTYLQSLNNKRSITPCKNKH